MRGLLFWCSRGEFAAGKSAAFLKCVVSLGETVPQCYELPAFGFGVDLEQEHQQKKHLHSFSVVLNGEIECTESRQRKHLFLCRLML